MSIERGSPEVRGLQPLDPAAGARAAGAEPPVGPVLSPDEVIQPDGTRVAFREGHPVDHSPEEEFAEEEFAARLFKDGHFQGRPFFTGTGTFYPYPQHQQR